jgi:HSP20 family protein
LYFEFHTERRHAWAPAVDVFERTHEIVILVEVPGIARADVKLSWHNGVLTISGDKREARDADNAKYHCVERISGHFRRDLTINIPIEHDKARAELRDGLMRIYLPKKALHPDKGEIPIE